MALPPSSQPEDEDYPANGRPSQDLDTTGRAHVGSLLNGKCSQGCNRRSHTVF
jgi:hypothetical protein